MLFTPRLLSLASILAMPVASIALAQAGGSTLQPKAGAPLQGLSPEELALFEVGKVLFATPPTIEQGLGPIFNKTNCQSCHSVPTGGWGSITVTRFGLDKKGEFFEYPGEVQSLLQAESISPSCKEILPADATVVSLRVTNSSLAFGIVDSIADADIVANADPTDSDGDGISGKVHYVEVLEDPTGGLRPGRFGWKAQVATLFSFSGDATRNEMGFTNSLVPTENPPNGDYSLLAQCDIAPDPEDVPDAAGYTFIERVTHFQRYLGMPPQTPLSGMMGETIFNQIGCAKCHVRDWQTPDDPNLEPALRNQSARIYSDFLLHDMGTLADGIQQGDANEFEFRTPVLWNLATRDLMLHDGRVAGGIFADRVTATIEAHGPFGEGAASAAGFAALGPAQKAQLVAFLRSLGRLEFDADFTGVIDIVDFNDFVACEGPTDPDQPCAVHDINRDGVINFVDAAAFLAAWEGPSDDCDSNSVPDAIDIALDSSLDSNGDGILDSCATCPADLDGNGAVDGSDLATLLSSWGGADADIDGNGTVDGQDLAQMLSAWGPCS
ncbi:MAG: hypothetical protein O2819_03270 [Planctomycetota bacterium]|nr:hypothetical protein [Planctomycetota bacterium]MDA1105759.1 hypothetical protein [Planctomycetota bacterium]